MAKIVRVNVDHGRDFHPVVDHMTKKFHQGRNFRVFSVTIFTSNNV